MSPRDLSDEPDDLHNVSRPFVHAVQRPMSPYQRLIAERRNIDSPTGIVDRVNRNYLYWDVFLARDMDTAIKLAAEIRSLFPNGRPNDVDRKAWDKLVNPQDYPKKGPYEVLEGIFKGQLRFEPEFSDGDANQAFMRLMGSLGLKPVTLANGRPGTFKTRHARMAAE